MKAVYILSAVRTATGKFGGSLRDFTAPDLGAAAAKAALERANVAPEDVEEAIFGHGRQAGSGPNPARQIAVRAIVEPEQDTGEIFGFHGVTGIPRRPSVSVGKSLHLP